MLPFYLAGPSGLAYSGSAVKENQDGTLGDYFDWVLGTFAPGPTNKLLTLVETADTGIYRAAYDGALEGYTGWLLRQYHDSGADNLVIQGERIYLTSGLPTGDYETVSSIDDQLQQIGIQPLSPVIVSDARTWIIRDTDDGILARNVVRMDLTQVAAVAFDFSSFLNEGTGITSVTSVNVIEGTNDLVITDVKPSQDRLQAHATIDAPSAGQRKLQAVVVTSDTQTLTGTARLIVE